MILPAHLNFFSIEECGLFKHGDGEPAALKAEETFDLIYKWVQGKQMEDTIPWDPAATKSGTPKCYCHDFYKCEVTGDYLFVLWKSDSDSVGTIWGAQASAQTGKSSVVEYTDNYEGKAVIWGRPCYYWVIPKLRTIVSVKLDHSVCDSTLFQEWVTKCITNRVKHPNKKKSQTETGQVRFEFTSEGDLARYAYRFDVKLRSVNTGSAHLQELSSRVTHVIRRDTIKLAAGKDERPTWVKIFDKIPHLPAKPKAKTRQIEVRAEAKPTAAEIKKIIETFAVEDRKRSDWNNVGFATDTGDVWVDRYRLHETVNFSKDDATVFAAADLHVRLFATREKLLEAIVRDNKVADASIVAAKKVIKAAAGKAVTKKSAATKNGPKISAKVPD